MLTALWVFTDAMFVLMLLAGVAQVVCAAWILRRMNAERKDFDAHAEEVRQSLEQGGRRTNGQILPRTDVDVNVSGAADSTSFRESRGQILKQMCDAAQAAARRNG